MTTIEHLHTQYVSTANKSGESVLIDSFSLFSPSHHHLSPQMRQTLNEYTYQTLLPCTAEKVPLIQHTVRQAF